MDNIIIYGSKYGSARRYAERLSQMTNIAAVNYKDAPSLSGQDMIVYIGAIYAGGVTGLTKTLRGLVLRESQKLIIATVGLADPNIAENEINIKQSLRAQLPAALFEKAEIFNLRGAIDYAKLSFLHRSVMALMYRTLKKLPREKWSPENQALIETYGKQVDFVDFDTLAPIVSSAASRSDCR